MAQRHKIRRRRRGLGEIALAAAALAFGLIAVLAAPRGQASAAVEARVIVASGHVRVIDGDTLELVRGGERIRLANVDTPEVGDRARCAAERDRGEAASAQARALVAGATQVVLRRTGRTDRYGRSIALVQVGERDLGEALIETGLARPWRGSREPWCDAAGGVLPT